MKIKKKQIEEIKIYTDLGKTAEEIAKILGITTGMVEYQRKINGWKSKYSSSILEKHLDAVKQYVNNKYSDARIGKIFNCSITTVFRFRKKHNLRQHTNLNSNDNKKLSKELIEVLLGTVMGDSSLNFRGISTRLVTEHSVKQSEYVYHLAEIFKCLEPSVNLTKQNTKYPAISLRTKSYPNLTEFYKSFYKDGKKVIPFELFDNFTERSLAYLIMDDGFPVRGKTGNVLSVGISLCSFSDEELQKFIDFLNEKFDLSFYITSHYNKHYQKSYKDIVLYNGEYKKLKKLINPYILNWAHYKIEGSKPRESEKVQSPLDNSNPSQLEIIERIND